MDRPPNASTLTWQIRSGMTDEQKNRKREGREARRADLKEKKQKQKQTARVVPVITFGSADDDKTPSFHPPQLLLPALAPALLNPHPNPRQRVPFVWVKDYEWKPAEFFWVVFWQECMRLRERKGMPMPEYGSLALPYKPLEQLTHMPVEVRRRRRLRKGEVVHQNQYVMELEMAEGQVDGASILDTSRMTEEDDRFAELQEKLKELGLED